MSYEKNLCASKMYNICFIYRNELYLFISISKQRNRSIYMADLSTETKNDISTIR